MDWKKNYREGMDAIAAETKFGSDFDIRVVAAQEYSDLINCGNQGDLTARRLVMSLHRWRQMVDAAMKDNQWPGCIACGTQIHQGGVVGWVVMLPVEDNRTGMVGAVCPECFRLGPKSVTDKALKLLEGYGEKHTVH